MSKHNYRFLGLVLLTVLVGLLAGVAGEVITRVYIFKDFSVPYLSGDLNVADLGANQSNLVIRNPQKVVVSADAVISETLNSLKPSLVGVFKALDPKNQSTTTPAYYNLDQPQFIGAVITSDGWVAATVPLEVKKNFNPKTFVALSSDRHLYTIDQVSPLKSLPADLLLFHLALANNLSVVRLAPRADLSAGQSLLVINQPNVAWPATLINIQPNVSATSVNSAVLSSDTFQGRLVLAALGEPFKNSFVFDLGGNLAAIIGANGEVVPAFSDAAYWQTLTLPNASQGLPALGVNYIDLSSVSPIGQTLNAGAWLYPSSAQPAVLKNSPAQAAGLQAGDVITWVDNQELNAANNLSDLIAAHQPGDKITLTYLRDNASHLVDVTLGANK